MSRFVFFSCASSFVLIFFLYNKASEGVVDTEALIERYGGKIEALKKRLAEREPEVPVRSRRLDFDKYPYQVRLLDSSLFGACLSESGGAIAHTGIITDFMQ